MTNPKPLPTLYVSDSVDIFVSNHLPESALLYVGGAPFDDSVAYVPASALEEANQRAGELGAQAVAMTLQRDDARVALETANEALRAANEENVRLRTLVATFLDADNSFAPPSTMDAHRRNLIAALAPKES